MYISDVLEVEDLPSSAVLFPRELLNGNQLTQQLLQGGP